MIVVRIIMNVLPAKQKEFMQTLLSLIETAGREKGCLRYDVFYGLKDNHIFNLIEEWKTREDLDRHILSERFSILLGTKSLLCEPPQIEIHTVSNSEGMEAVNAARGKRF